MYKGSGVRSKKDVGGVSLPHHYSTLLWAQFACDTRWCMPNSEPKRRCPRHHQSLVYQFRPRRRHFTVSCPARQPPGQMAVILWPHFPVLALTDSFEPISSTWQLRCPQPSQLHSTRLVKKRQYSDRFMGGPKGFARLKTALSFFPPWDSVPSQTAPFPLSLGPSREISLSKYETYHISLDPLSDYVAVSLHFPRCQQELDRPGRFPRHAFRLQSAAFPRCAGAKANLATATSVAISKWWPSIAVASSTALSF